MEGDFLEPVLALSLTLRYFPSTFVPETDRLWHAGTAAAKTYELGLLKD